MTGAGTEAGVCSVERGWHPLGIHLPSPTLCLGTKPRCPRAASSSPTTDSEPPVLGCTELSPRNQGEQPGPVRSLPLPPVRAGPLLAAGHTPGSKLRPFKAQVARNVLFPGLG